MNMNSNSPCLLQVNQKYLLWCCQKVLKYIFEILIFAVLILVAFFIPPPLDTPLEVNKLRCYSASHTVYSIFFIQKQKSEIVIPQCCGNCPPWYWILPFFKVLYWIYVWKSSTLSTNIIRKRKAEQRQLLILFIESWYLDYVVLTFGSQNVPLRFTPGRWQCCADKTHRRWCSYQLWKFVWVLKRMSHECTQTHRG